MVKLVDTADLSPAGFGRPGSSPGIPTATYCFYFYLPTPEQNACSQSNVSSG